MGLEYLELMPRIFDLEILVFLVLGITGGIAIGATPGLTPTMGVALLLPFTFGLQPVQGLLLLGGIYVGSVYGGSISATLIKIPGAPASIATTFDGYPMAKRGEAQKALYLSLISSVVGGIVGILALILFAPALADFSLRFGPAENFWVAVLGITIIASMSVGCLLKGITGGLIGLFLSTIGICSISGTTRFTFGSTYLVGGMNLIAVLIGLFAFSQALEFFEETFKEKNTHLYKIIYRKGVFRESLKQVRQSWKFGVLGSVIGSVVGIIPGAGGQIASLISYNEAKKLSKQPDEFGKGNPEGLIAAETANNAMVGGSLIPMLTLGIPGSPTAAIMLGGLLIHGLWPGPEMFTTYRHITFTFISGMLLAQLLMLVIGYMGIKYVCKLIDIPKHYLSPAILVLCMFGAYAAQNNLVHVFVMVATGLLMYLGTKMGFSPAPVALGMILGNYAESGFLLARRIGVARGIGYGQFINSPIALVLIVLSAISISVTILLEYRVWQEKTKTIIHRMSSTGKFLDKLVSLTLLICGAVLMYVALQLPAEAGLFPQIVLGLMLLCAIALLTNRGSPQEMDTVLSLPWRPQLGIMGICLVFLLVSLYLGFYLATALTLLLSVILIKSYRDKSLHLQGSFIYAVSFTGLLYLIFSVALRVPI